MLCLILGGRMMRVIGLNPIINNPPNPITTTYHPNKNTNAHQPAKQTPLKNNPQHTPPQPTTNKKTTQFPLPLYKTKKISPVNQIYKNRSNNNKYI